MSERTTEIRTELWYIWTEVAIEHESHAWETRAAYPGHHLSGAVVEGLMEKEVKAVLIAVTAAANGLDAFYTACADLGIVPLALRQRWRVNGTARHAQLLETVSRTFDVGSYRRSWQVRLDRLFDLRNETVHYRSTPGELSPHPVGVETTPVGALYTAEVASESVDLAIELMSACISHPRPRPEVRAWTKTWSHAPKDFSVMRLEADDRRSRHT